MIRYDITKAELLARIDQVNPTWRTRAAARTALFRQAHAYLEPPAPFWGEIKSVYIALQKNKCAFCERELTHRRKDHDVEHFRPKRAVEPWPPLATDPAFDEGYYLLAYHPLNYVTACEHCNRGLKRSYFPVQSSRTAGQGNPTRLSLERPLLIYPLGRIDTNPEKLLGFEGIVPVPKNTDTRTYEHQRAKVSIEFFDLEKREELRRERAKVIQTLYIALISTEASNEELREIVQSTLEQRASNRFEHTNCARCFVKLYQQNPEEAKRLAKLAVTFLSQLV